jgi:Lysosomal transcription factor, NCU-G1
LGQLKEFSNKEHGSEFPHLLHSSNSTQIDIVLNHVKIVSGFSNPRFAIEILLFCTEDLTANNTFYFSKRKSIDDEHTPGIFEVYDILSPKSMRDGGGAYIQFRPVSYTHPERDVTTSTETHLDSFQFVTGSDAETELAQTLAWSVYGKDVRNFLVQGLNVTLGLTGDGYYSKSNYSTFTFVMGFGTPPLEELSTLITIVACIGLGIPLLLIVVGTCYICVKRMKRSSSLDL